MTNMDWIPFSLCVRCLQSKGRHHPGSLAEQRLSWVRRGWQRCVGSTGSSGLYCHLVEHVWWGISQRRIAQRNVTWLCESDLGDICHCSGVWDGEKCAMKDLNCQYWCLHRGETPGARGVPWCARGLEAKLQTRLPKKHTKTQHVSSVSSGLNSDQRRFSTSPIKPVFLDRCCSNMCIVCWVIQGFPRSSFYKLMQMIEWSWRIQVETWKIAQHKSEFGTLRFSLSSAVCYAMDLRLKNLHGHALFHSFVL